MSVEVRVMKSGAYTGGRWRGQWPLLPPPPVGMKIKLCVGNTTNKWLDGAKSKKQKYFFYFVPVTCFFFFLERSPSLGNFAELSPRKS